MRRSGGEYEKPRNICHVRGKLSVVNVFLWSVFPDLARNLSRNPVVCNLAAPVESDGKMWYDKQAANVGLTAVAA